METSEIKPNLYFIAHRMNVGSPDNETYNQVDNGMEALDAFLEAVSDDTGAGHIKGFECDVRLTADNELVVVHDGNVKTMTGDKLNKNISDFTYDELRQLEIKNANFYYNGLKNRALILPDSGRIRKIIGQRLQRTTAVPKAFEMFEYLAAKGCKKEIVLELKDASDVTRDAAIELINTYKNKLHIVAKGYDARRVMVIGEKTGVKIGQLEAIKLINQEREINADYIKTMPFDFYSILWTKCTGKKMAALAEYGKDLYTWTIDSAAHLFGVFSLLERFYNKSGTLPQNIHLISNIPILLEEYLSDEGPAVALEKSIRRQNDRLFKTPEAVLII